MDLGNINFDKPFDEQLAYFRSKGFVFSPFSWEDVWQDAHAHAFTVARVTSMNILKDIRQALDDAMESGTTLKQFKNDLIPILEQKGWFAPPKTKQTIEMPDGTKRKRLTGWRLDTIFGTNMAAAYNVGRYKQKMELAELRPYWQYMAVRDGSSRPSHAKLHGTVYRYDHPFWDSWYPPNGFNCRCYVKSLDADDLADRNLTPETDLPEDLSGDPIKPDYGWDYNVGKAGLDAWKPKMGDYDKVLAQQYQKGLKAAKKKAVAAAKTAVQTPKPLNVKNRKDVENILSDKKISSFLTNSGGQLNALNWKPMDAFASTDTTGTINISTRADLVFLWDPKRRQYQLKKYKMSDELMRAFKNLGKRPLTFSEEYSLEGLWHEILHNRQQISEHYRATAFDISIMEMVNQYLARRSYPLFLDALGGYAPEHLEDIKLHGIGYSGILRRFDKIINHIGVAEDDIGPKLVEMHQNNEWFEYEGKLIDALSDISGADKMALFHVLEAIELDEPQFETQLKKLRRKK
jgi:SPP1 gp7 family putative phage head morphogenesis protein